MTPVSKNMIPKLWLIDIAEPVKNFNKVVIGEPNNKIAVANETLTCLRPLYQVKTYKNNMLDVTNIQLSCALEIVKIFPRLFVKPR